MAEPRASGEIYGHSFDEVFHDLLFYLSRYPDFVCSPRGQKIKECLAQTLVLEDPRARLICNPARKANYGFASGEYLWYWNGHNDLETMKYYNKRMGDFSDDGVTINSAYGARMCKFVFGKEVDITQWEACIRTLSSDTDSRRALLLINSPEDQVRAATVGTKDVPCTLSLQFFIRENKLHVHVHMRSNDAIWGLTNDLFSFTLFQECMLLELRERDPVKFGDLELGTYYHTAGSLHIYERHFELAEQCLELYRKPGQFVHEVMPPLTSLTALRMLSQDEENLRKGYIDRIRSENYTGGEFWLAEKLNEHRQKRDAEEALKGDKKAG